MARLAFAHQWSDAALFRHRNLHDAINDVAGVCVCVWGGWWSCRELREARRSPRLATADVEVTKFMAHLAKLARSARLPCGHCLMVPMNRHLRTDMKGMDEFQRQCQTRTGEQIAGRDEFRG